MAKKVDLEAGDFDKEVLEEVTALEEEPVEIAPLDAEPDEAGPEGAGPEDAEPEPEEEPQGKNTGLTITLCVLNVLAALGFTFLLVLDFQKRQEWSYAVFMNELFIQGLPLKEDDEAPSAARATLPRQKLDAEQLKAVASQRGVMGSGDFWAVDEPLPNRIQAQYLTPEILKDYFGSLGAEVATLEEEIVRLKAKVPADIAQAAQDAVAAYKGKDDAAKRKFAGKILLSLAYDIFQVEALDRKLKATKGLELDTLIDDAVQRRLLVDILAPCEIYRPAEVANVFLEKVADLNNFKLDQLKKLLEKRFDVAVADKFDGAVHFGKEWDGEKRHSWEKRQTIGFLLVAIASVHKPDLANPAQTSPLYPDGGAAGTPTLLRAQTVLGLYDFAVAVQNLPIAWNLLEERVIQAIQVDRQGFNIVFKDKDGKFKEMDGKPARNQAFIDNHDTEIKRILDLTVEIKQAENRLKDLQKEHKDVKKSVEDRTEYLQAVTKQLLAARAETATMVAELRDLQQQLYRAQAELRDADERNLRLLDSIRAEERKAKGLKGAKTP